MYPVMKRFLRLTVVPFALILLLGATPLLAAPKAQPSPGWEGSGGGARLNHLQARGSHNSYHRDPKWPGREHPTFGWDYSHSRLARQFEEQDIRQVELDVHWNWARGEFEVYHAWFGDDRTTCELLRECLAEIRAWSDARPAHHPVMVLVEPKDGMPPEELPENGDPFTGKIGPAELAELDRVLLGAFGGPYRAGGRVLTPDDVTAPGLSLRESILSEGWPRIDQVRGHMLYVIDGDADGAAYSANWTSLAGRAAFVQAEADRAVAAFVTRDGARLPGEGKYDRMRRLVTQGFMVRDYVSPGGFEASKAAGAHFLSTDDHDQLVLSEDPDAPSRCNPVTAEDSCRDTKIEWHRAGGMSIPADPSDDAPAIVTEKADRLAVHSAESAAAYAERQRP